MPESPIPNASDLLLVFLIRAADQRAMSNVRITVLISGAMISGTVIGIGEYRRRVVQGFADASPTEDQEKTLRQTFEEVLGSMELLQSHVEWLHLSDCVISQGDRIIPIFGNGGQLRIRTADVAGWMFGGLDVPGA